MPRESRFTDSLSTLSGDNFVDARNWRAHAQRAEFNRVEGRGGEEVTASLAQVPSIYHKDGTTEIEERVDLWGAIILPWRRVVAPPSIALFPRLKKCWNSCSIPSTTFIFLSRLRTTFSVGPSRDNSLRSLSVQGVQRQVSTSVSGRRNGFSSHRWQWNDYRDGDVHRRIKSRIRTARVRIIALRVIVSWVCECSNTDTTAGTILVFFEIVW